MELAVEAHLPTLKNSPAHHPIRVMVAMEDVQTITERILTNEHTMPVTRIVFKNGSFIYVQENFDYFAGAVQMFSAIHMPPEGRA